MCSDSLSRESYEAKEIPPGVGVAGCVGAAGAVRTAPWRDDDGN